jgi:hypothetical protein
MPASNIKLTLIGGPTVLIEYDGLRILTDPTFDPPGQYQGSHSAVRHVKTAGPALSAEHVGKLDAILLSHDHHFDNLDKGEYRERHSNAKRVSSVQVDHTHGVMRSSRSVSPQCACANGRADDAGECGVVKRPRNRFILTVTAAAVRLGRRLDHMPLEVKIRRFSGAVSGALFAISALPVG